MEEFEGRRIIILLAESPKNSNMFTSEKPKGKLRNINLPKCNQFLEDVYTVYSIIIFLPTL